MAGRLPPNPPQPAQDWQPGGDRQARRQGLSAGFPGPVYARRQRALAGNHRPVFRPVRALLCAKRVSRPELPGGRARNILTCFSTPHWPLAFAWFSVSSFTRAYRKSKRGPTGGSMAEVDRKTAYRAEDLAGFDPDRELGYPGQYPFTRGIRPTMYRGRLWTMRQYSGMGDADAIQPPLQVSAGPGRRRPFRGVRPAHPAGLRFRLAVGRRRGGQSRGGHRFDRRHGTAVCRHPAGRGFDLHDHQCHGNHSARPVMSRRPGVAAAS